MANRDLRIIVSTDTRGAVRGFARVDAAAGHTGKGLDHLKAAAMGAGVALGGLAAVGIKQSVTAAVNLGEEINKTRVVFRGSEKDILRWSKTTAASLGISRREALESAGVFGNMLVPMGFARDRAGQMSKRMVQLAADMASFNNASPADTLDAIRSGLAGESEPLRRYGVFLNDARLKQEALNLGLKNSVGPNGALTTSAKAQATYSLILKDSTDAQGDFHRTSSSLANQQRVLKAEFEDVSAKLGTKLIPMLTAAAKWLTRFVHQMETGKGAGGVFVDVLKAIGDAIEEVVVSFIHFGKWIGNAIHNITRFGHGVRDVLRGVWGFFSDTFNNIKRIFGNVMAALYRGFAKLFDVASHIPGIGGKFKDLADKANQAADKVDKLGEEVKRLPRKKEIQVMVKTAWQDFLSGDVKPLVQSPGGDGWGIEGKVTNSARGAVQRGIANGSINPFGSVGALPLFGGEGGLMGANPILSPFAALGNRMGLRVTSGFRPGSITSSGNLSLHATGHAIDMADGPGAMLSYGLLMARAFGSRLKELIHSPMGFSIKNGQRVAPYAVADHYDHVHVAMAKGGQARTAVRALVGEKGPEVVDLPAGAIVHPSGVSRKLKTGDGWGRALIAARRAGFRGRSLQTALAVAAAESGNFTDFIGDGGQSFSPWQIYLPAHPQYSRSRLLSDWTYAARAAYSISSGGSNWGPWTMFNNGGYRAYLDDAARAIAGSRRGLGRRGGGHHGGGKPRGSHGPTTTADIIAQGQDTRFGFKWEDLQSIRDDEVVTPDEYSRTNTAYMRRAATLNKRIDRKKQRLRKINRALRGKLRPATRRRLLEEKGQLLSDIGGIEGDLRSLTGEFNDLTAPFDGAGGGDDLRQQQLDAQKAHTEALKEQIAQMKRNEDLIRSQGGAMIGGLIQLANTGIGGNAGLGRQFPSSTGLGGLSRA